jgi:hypothetical protein
MVTKTFRKTLSANDVGTTGGHMGGILVPKGDRDLLAFLPPLDSAKRNPDAWIECKTVGGIILRLRFVYYNNRFHPPLGTRNEYRITGLTKFLREGNARQGDTFEISRNDGLGHYQIRLILTEHKETFEDDSPIRIRLTTGWRSVH